MPLYEHKSGRERVRTIPNSYEDNRLGLSDDWQSVDEQQQEQPAAASEPPAPNARKDDWMAYAISQGMPSYEAHAATKDELIERHGG